MYEAKQERSKQARVIDNNNKVNNPYIHINQMMSKKNNDNTNYRTIRINNRIADCDSNRNIECGDPIITFINRLKDFATKIDKTNITNIKSFYQVYFLGMGPHTIARSSIIQTINDLSIENVSNRFYQLIQTPKQIRLILANEGILYPASKYNENLGLNSERLNLYINTYSELYEVCCEIVDYFHDNHNFIDLLLKNKNTYSDDYYDCNLQIDKLFAFLCGAMDNLLNLNPYATYAWHRTTGCTPAEISGKREIPTILHDVSEENFKEEMKKFLDPLSLESQTFCDIDGFANYLCAFFPHIDRQIIEDVLSNMPRQTISISEEEIQNYFKDMINGNYSYSHKEIATISIIQHVNMELFVQEICKTDYAKEICELLFTVLSNVYSSYKSKTNELIMHLAKVENKDFQANLTEILSDEFIVIYDD